MRSSRATAPPVSKARLAPSPKPRSGLRRSSTWAIQDGKSGEGRLTASIPAVAIRISSNILAFLEKNAVAFAIISSVAIFSSETAIRPKAVVPTSGLPPGVGANPPVSASKHDLTYLMQASTSGIEPPAYLSARIADEVEPRLDVPPGLPVNPPSGFWNAAMNAAVRAISSDDSGASARTTGASTSEAATRLPSNRFMFMVLLRRT
jgi:hypothetical protein